MNSKISVTLVFFIGLEVLKEDIFDILLNRIEHLSCIIEFLLYLVSSICTNVIKFRPHIYTLYQS